jgi:hypothetical protein
MTAWKKNGSFDVGIGLARVACMFQLNPTVRPELS